MAEPQPDLRDVGVRTAWALEQLRRQPGTRVERDGRVYLLLEETGGLARLLESLSDGTLNYQRTTLALTRLGQSDPPAKISEPAGGGKFRHLILLDEPTEAPSEGTADDPYEDRPALRSLMRDGARHRRRAEEAEAAAALLEEFGEQAVEDYLKVGRKLAAAVKGHPKATMRVDKLLAEALGLGEPTDGAPSD